MKKQKKNNYITKSESRDGIRFCGKGRNWAEFQIIGRTLISVFKEKEEEM